MGFSLFLLLENGVVYGCGLGSDGQLGCGKQESDNLFAVKMHLNVIVKSICASFQCSYVLACVFKVWDLWEIFSLL